MKKAFLIITAIVLVSVLAVGFAACNNATPQGQLADIFGNSHVKETFNYDVTDNTDPDAAVNGKYSVVMEKRKGDIQVGDNTVNDVREGVLITSTLTMDNGTEYVMQCLYDVISGSSFLVPRASYRKETENGSTRVLNAVYNGPDFAYKYDDNGSISEGNLECGGIYYDNNEFHQALRGLTTMGDGAAYSFNVPIARQEAVVASVTARFDGRERLPFPGYENEEDESKSGVECFKVNLSRATEVAGSGQTLYYSVENMTANGWPVLKHVLVKFVEKDVTYTLTDMSIA